MELFVLDLGNRQTKLKKGEQVEVLPSYFVEASQFGDRNVMGFAKQQQDVADYTSTLDDSTYVWGTELDVETDVTVTDTLKFGLERYQSLEFKLLTDFALAKLAQGQTDAIKGTLDVNVVTGLPTQDYANEPIIKAVGEAIKGDHTVMIDEQKLNIRVHDVHALPQPLGTVINEITNDAGEVIDSAILNTSVAVVDIGGGTLLIDILNKMNVDITKRRQSNDGAYKLYNLIIALVAQHHGITLSEYEVERIVKQGNQKEVYTVSLDGITDIDITDLVMQARQSYTDEVITKVKSALKTTQRISMILVTGGTANLLIKTQFTKAFLNAKFVVNSEVANVNGFYKFALAEGLI